MYNNQILIVKQLQSPKKYTLVIKWHQFTGAFSEHNLENDRRVDVTLKITSILGQIFRLQSNVGISK